MKIKISANEFYEIKFDSDEITAEEFLGFMNRLRIIEKLLMKDEISTPIHKGQNVIKKTRNTSIVYPWKNNRAELIKILKVIYFNDIAGRKNYEKMLNASWDTIYKNVYYQKKIKKIRPDEVGLKYWPSSRGTGSYNIKQAAINNRGDDYGRN